MTGPACVTLSYRSNLLHIGLGRAHAGSRVLPRAADLDVRVITDEASSSAASPSTPPRTTNPADDP